jgi:hypothetical protein
MAIRCTQHLQAAVLSHGFSSQFAVQRNEHILTKIVQNKLFLQKCGIDTKLHISTFRGYRILFSIRNPYINRFTNHFSIHS